MGFLREWVKNIVCYLCFVQIVEQLLPQGNYQKYVRFFCGLLLIVIVISPFTDAAGLSDRLALEWRTTMLQEEWASLNMEQESLEQLRRKTINDACKAEMERQVAAVAEGNGMEDVQAEVTFGSEDGGLTMELVRIAGNYPQGADKEKIRQDILQELIQIYQVEGRQVVFDA